MNYRKNWFTTIIAVIITAVLIMSTLWILELYISEGKINKVVYNSIASYAWAEWSLEYAMLKLKNHKEWFEDKIDENDFDSWLLKQANLVKNKNQTIFYEIENYSKSYAWTIWSYKFEIIPLFFDSWELIQKNSKDYRSETIKIERTENISLKTKDQKSIIWNIIWNNSLWNTFWISWSWTEINNSSKGSKKDVFETEWVFDFDFSLMSIWDFINNKNWNTYIYENNYLILYNPNPEEITYNIDSKEWFGLPKTKIIASSKIWEFRQNLNLERDNSEMFELLKYWVFNK